MTDAGTRTVERSAEFHELVRDATPKRQGVLGYWYKNLVTGEGHGLRQDELFPTAGIFRIPVTIKCFRLAEQGCPCLCPCILDADPAIGAGPLFRGKTGV